MKSLDIYEQDQAVILLRKTTRTNEDSRTVLCSERFLFALKQLLNSCYAALQTNAAAALVNLSLEKEKKIKIVRAGVVPLLIEILRSGYEESREHAAGAIFSLALEDENTTAIGVLGALQPLLHELRSGTRRSRHDAVLALYHLTLVQSNRVKIMKLGAVGILLGLLKEAEVTARVILAQKHASVRRSSTPQDVRHVSDASRTFPSGSLHLLVKPRQLQLRPSGFLPHILSLIRPTPNFLPSPSAGTRFSPSPSCSSGRRVLSGADGLQHGEEVRQVLIDEVEPIQSVYQDF